MLFAPHKQTYISAFSQLQPDVKPLQGQGYDRILHQCHYYYPSPTRSVCEDTLVVPLVIPRLRVA